MKKIFPILLLLLCCSPAWLLGQQTNHWESIFLSTSNFKYYTSSEGVWNPDWRDPDFNDDTWRSGPGGIGFGDGDDNTQIEACVAVAIRKSFTILDKSTITEAALHMDYDDAFVAYLNGTEIARSAGLSDAFPAYNKISTSNHEAVGYNGGIPEGFLIKGDDFLPALVDGENTLAVQVHNSSLTSSDLTAIITLSVGLSTSERQYLYTPPWFEPPFAFSSSTLPIILIDTDGASIPNEPKITARMKIIYNGEGRVNSIDDNPNEYDGFIGIEVRGASSSGYPQKPWSLETRDSLGLNNNVPLLGMPRENDWVLLSHYNEKSFVRNPISFHLFREMGHYATRNRLVEVVLNGSYEGIYMFGEKIKRDRWRVNISEIYPHNNSGDSLTGGYIFKTEYYGSHNTWQSDYSPIHHPSYSTHFAYYSPKYYLITQEQKNYIKYSVDQFQQILSQSNFADKYHNYIDVPSFIDYFIISEVSRNVDGYKKSRYLYKDQDSKGGLIHSGPVWDFDWAWKNIYDCAVFRLTDGSGWAYKINDCLSNPSPGWMTRLLEDPEFQNSLKCRYTELRGTILSDEYINSFIDSIYNQVYEPQKNHFKRWKVLGVGTGAPEVEAPSMSFDEEVTKLRSWIDIRLKWLDENMPGSDEDCGVSTDDKLDPVIIFRMFPNPASSDLYIESDQVISKIQVLSLSGRILKTTQPSGSYSVYMNIADLESGLYLVIVNTENGLNHSEKLIVQ